MIVDKNIKSLAESVFLQLEEDILDGTLKKGDVLTEIALAQKLGVSRTPLRSALHALAEEGLIEITPNKGATVVGVSRDDLVDIYKIRMRLEGIAAGLAAKRISDENIKFLENSVELSEFFLSKGDSDHLKELDSEFQNIIYKASGSRHIAKILTELHRNIRSYRKLSLSVPSRLDISVKEHRAILEAIKAHDSELAERLCCEHIEAALNNLLPIVDKGESTEA